MKQMMTSKCRRFVKRTLLLLLLIACSMSVGAQTTNYYKLGSTDIDGVRYDLYECVIVYWPGAPENTFYFYYASVSGIVGTQEEVVVQSSFTYEGNYYMVNDLHYNLQHNIIQNTVIYNNYVKVIRFKGSINFHPSTNTPIFNCPNLTDIYFEGATPTLTETYAAHFRNPGTNTITVHVSDKTRAEIEELKTQAVWSDFRNIVGRYPTRLMLTAGPSGKTIEVWDYKEQVCSISPKGGTVWKDLSKTEYIQFRIPNQYLQKIIMNGDDVTTTLPSSTPTDPAYDGYTFYTLSDFDDFTVVEAKFSGGAPETIHFADANVKAICVSNWDTDHDGELSMVEAAAVTSLNVEGNSAFSHNETITSFDELQYFTGLTQIDDYAFYNCSNLKKIQLSDNVQRIGSFAFYGTAIQTIFIPASVSLVDGTAFSWCNNLAAIIVDAANPTYDSPGNSLAVIEKSDTETYLIAGCKNTVIPEDVTRLHCYSLEDRHLEELVIPQNVKGINERALTGNNLKILTMKRKEPIRFSADAFDSPLTNNCKLIVPAGTRDAYIAKGWTEEIFKGGVVEESEIINFADPAVKAICVENWDTDHDGELSQAEAAAVTSLKVGSNSVFRDNTTITSFDELQYFTGLARIENHAFYSCKSLKSIIMPKQVVVIEMDALYGCEQLESVLLPDSLRSIGGYAFQNCKALTSLIIPDSVETIGTQCFLGCLNLKRIVLSENLKSIGQNAFRRCIRLQQLFIPKNVTSIGTFNAGGNSNLISLAVDIDNSVYESPEGCNAIVEKSTGKLVMGCNTTRIPSSVRTLDNGSMYNLIRIRKIEIPANVEHLGAYALADCFYVTSVVAKGETPPTLDNDALSSIGSNCILTVPYGKTKAYRDAGWGDGQDGSPSIFKSIVEDNSQYDTNHDGIMNITDVTTLVSKILNM